eukprot:1769849-Amphidinium_carterae.2
MVVGCHHACVDRRSESWLVSFHRDEQRCQKVEPTSENESPKARAQERTRARVEVHLSHLCPRFEPSWLRAHPVSAKVNVSIHGATATKHSPMYCQCSYEGSEFSVWLSTITKTAWEAWPTRVQHPNLTAKYVPICLLC